MFEHELEQALAEVASGVPYVPPRFEEAYLVGNNRFNDIKPYIENLLAQDYHKWGAIMPWEFPQYASRELEEAFLRRIFGELEVHCQGGMTGEGAGYRFLKQIFYTTAIANVEQYMPQFLDYWRAKPSSQSLFAQEIVPEHMLRDDTDPSAFFERAEIEWYGPAFLKHAIWYIQVDLKWQQASRQGIDPSTIPNLEHPATRNGVPAIMESSGNAQPSQDTAEQAPITASEDIEGQVTTEQAPAGTSEDIEGRVTIEQAPSDVSEEEIREKVKHRISVGGWETYPIDPMYSLPEASLSAPIIMGAETGEERITAPVAAEEATSLTELAVQASTEHDVQQQESPQAVPVTDNNTCIESAQVHWTASATEAQMAPSQMANVHNAALMSVDGAYRMPNGLPCDQYYAPVPMYVHQHPVGQYDYGRHHHQYGDFQHGPAHPRGFRGGRGQQMNRGGWRNSADRGNYPSTYDNMGFQHHGPPPGDPGYPPGHAYNIQAYPHGVAAPYARNFSLPAAGNFQNEPNQRSSSIPVFGSFQAPPGPIDDGFGPMDRLLGPDDVTRYYIGINRTDVINVVLFWTRDWTVDDVVGFFRFGIGCLPDGARICHKYYGQEISTLIFVQLPDSHWAREALKLNRTFWKGGIIGVEVSKVHWSTRLQHQVSDYPAHMPQQYSDSAAAYPPPARHYSNQARRGSGSNTAVHSRGSFGSHDGRGYHGPPPHPAPPSHDGSGHRKSNRGKKNKGKGKMPASGHGSSIEAPTVVHVDDASMSQRHGDKKTVDTHVDETKNDASTTDMTTSSINTQATTGPDATSSGVGVLDAESRVTQNVTQAGDELSAPHTVPETAEHDTSNGTQSKETGRGGPLRTLVVLKRAPSPLMSDGVASPSAKHADDTPHVTDKRYGPTDRSTSQFKKVSDSSAPLSQVKTLDKNPTAIANGTQPDAIAISVPMEAQDSAIGMEIATAPAVTGYKSSASEAGALDSAVVLSDTESILPVAKPAPKVAAVSTVDAGSTVPASAPKDKERNKAKGPSQTESLSMFGKKQAKSKKKDKSKGSIKKKPEEMNSSLAARNDDMGPAMQSVPYNGISLDTATSHAANLVNKPVIPDSQVVQSSPLASVTADNQKPKSKKKKKSTKTHAAPASTTLAADVLAHAVETAGDTKSAAPKPTGSMLESVMDILRGRSASTATLPDDTTAVTSPEKLEGTPSSSTREGVSIWAGPLVDTDSPPLTVEGAAGAQCEERSSLVLTTSTDELPAFTDKRTAIDDEIHTANVFRSSVVVAQDLTNSSVLQGTHKPAANTSRRRQRRCKQASPSVTNEPNEEVTKVDTLDESSLLSRTDADNLSDTSRTMSAYSRHSSPSPGPLPARQHGLPASRDGHLLRTPPRRNARRRRPRAAMPSSIAAEPVHSGIQILELSTEPGQAGGESSIMPVRVHDSLATVANIIIYDTSEDEDEEEAPQQDSSRTLPLLQILRVVAGRSPPSRLVSVEELSTDTDDRIFEAGSDTTESLPPLSP